jgi:hypothetical protein
MRGIVETTESALLQGINEESEMGNNAKKAPAKKAGVSAKKNNDGKKIKKVADSKTDNVSKRKIGGPGKID